MFSTIYIFIWSDWTSVHLFALCFSFIDSLYSSPSNYANRSLKYPVNVWHFLDKTVLSLSDTLPLSTICQSILLIEASLCVSTLLFPASVAFQSISSHPYCSNSRVHLNDDISSKALLVLCQWMEMCFLVICCAPGFVAK